MGDGSGVAVGFGVEVGMGSVVAVAGCGVGVSICPPQADKSMESSRQAANCDRYGLGFTSASFELTQPDRFSCGKIAAGNFAAGNFAEGICR